MAPTTRTALTGKTIWLTRPAGQGAELRAALEQAGARVHLLPLLEIRPLPPSQSDKQKLIDLDHYHLVFYVSTTAATLGLDAIAQWWPQYPASIRNFAVGPGTAAVLAKRGLGVSYPDTQMNSEALLALPELQKITGEKALIVRGAGGREILAGGLRARGVQVDYAELYQRALPRYEPSALQALAQDAAPDAIVISSAEALDNLKTLTARTLTSWDELPLVVASVRLAEHAQKLGFEHTAVIEGASDAAIIKGLLSVFGKGTWA